MSTRSRAAAAKPARRKAKGPSVEAMLAELRQQRQGKA